MKKMIFGYLFFCVCAFALSEDAKLGDELYLEAKCNRCHGSGLEYISKAKSEETSATNYKKLAQWVYDCNIFFRTSFFPEDEEAVVTYLNEVYYEFERK